MFGYHFSEINAVVFGLGSLLTIITISVLVRLLTQRQERDAAFLARIRQMR